MNLRLAPALLVIALSTALFLYGPIAQLDQYHNFADKITWLGIANGADVVSNLGFVAVGLLCLYLVLFRGQQATPGGSRYGWGLFGIALVLTAAGSSFYHLQPDNFRLLFDRLPIALACAGLLAAVRSENVPGAHGARDTVLLALFAVASVLWWALTERTGSDDLRPYLALQTLPLLLIPLWQAIYKAPRRERLVMANAIALYVAAKAAELSDHQIFELTGSISGHTIKHLLAAAAAAVIVMQLRTRTMQRRLPAGAVGSITPDART